MIAYQSTWAVRLRAVALGRAGAQRGADCPNYTIDLHATGVCGVAMGQGSCCVATQQPLPCTRAFQIFLPAAVWLIGLHRSQQLNALERDIYDN